MLKYHLHYLADMDDAMPKEYVSHEPVRVGEIIRPGSYFHRVVAVREQKTGTRLDLAKSGLSEEEARLALHP